MCGTVVKKDPESHYVIELIATALNVLAVSFIHQLVAVLVEVAVLVFTCYIIALISLLSHPLEPLSSMIFHFSERSIYVLC